MWKVIGFITVHSPNVKMMNYAVLKHPRELDRQEWGNFVNEHPEGTIFHLPGFYDSYLNTKNYCPLFLAIKDSSGSLIGLFIAVIQKDYFFPFSYLTRRVIVFGGPLIKNNDLSVLELLLKEVDVLCKKRSIYIQFRNFIPQSDSFKNAYSKLNYTYFEHLNILVDLTVGKEELWKGVKRNRKDGINKAKKQSFTFEVSDELENLQEFYNLLKETYKNIKLPYPDKSFFEYLNKELKGSLKWFILKHEDKTVIVLASFIHKGTIYAFYIGIARDNKTLNLRPVDLFYWNVLEWGVNNKLKIFDWMGAGSPSKDYGVRTFKLQYGGEIYEMGRYEKIYSPMLYNLTLSLYRIWKSII